MNALLSVGLQLFNWTWQTSVPAGCLAVLILGVQKLLGRRVPQKLRYCLGLLVVCRLLLPVTPTSPLSLESLFWRMNRCAAAQRSPATLRPPPDTRLGPTGSEQASISVEAGPSLSWGKVLGVAWACGCLALVGAAGWRYGKWNRLVRSGKRISDRRLLSILEEAREAMGVRRSVTLVSMPEVGSPAVFGVWRVWLLLPEATRLHLDERELRLVFMHEMAHLRRNDGLLDVILMGLQFLHWFNPLVWLAFHRLRAERELVCDAMVLRQSAEAERLDYGRLLIKLADSLCAREGAIPAVIPVIGRKRDLKRRIVAIKQGQPTSWFSVLATGLAAGAVGCLTFTGATQSVSPVGTESHSVPLDQPPAANSVTATNGVVLKFADSVLRARGLSVDLDKGSLVARGDVNVRQSKPGSDPGESVDRGSASNGITLRRDGVVIAGKEMLYDFQTGQVRVGGPFTFKRDALVLNGDQLTYNLNTKETASESKVTEVEIKFVGPPLVGEQEIRTSIHVKLGSPFDLETVDQDVRSLYATGRFYSVRVSTEKIPAGTKVTYTVQCNPELVEVQFKGNRAFTGAQLRKWISCKIGDHPGERKLFLEAQNIQNEYETAGHKGTKVRYSTIVDAASGKAKVTFEIAEPR